MPKVSIIVIIYKVEMFLRECLESIVDQSYENIEIILVVGKGDEKCEEISRDFAADPRVKLIVDEPKGTAVARNAGLNAATGDYIAFVDGDDKIARDMIKTMVDAAVEENADVSVVGKYLMYENMTEGSEENTKEVFSNRDAFETILYNDKFFLHMWDKLYRRELFSGIRFDEGRQVEDRQMAVKILGRAEKVVYNSASKYYFRVSRDSGSRVKDNLRLSLDADKKICEELGNRYKDLNDAIEYFLMVENMSVVQSAYLYNIFSNKNNKDELTYIRKHLSYVWKLGRTSRGMKFKMILCGYFPHFFRYVTISRRNKFLKTHVEFGSGNNWAETFRKQSVTG